ncbi:MAG: hypothetical protein IKM98_06865, partial [Bacteroidales bacterium]|nr:hypothetical protein [Bacteroidales bacterium]
YGGIYPDEDETSDKQATNIDTVDKTSDKQAINDTVSENGTLNDTVSGNDTVNDTVNGQDDTVNGTVNGQDGTVNVKANDTVKENGTLNDTLKSQIIEMIRVNPNVNAFQLIKLLNKSLRQIRRLLAKLQAEGTIRRVGADKNGHWEVIDNQSEK